MFRGLFASETAQIELKRGRAYVSSIDGILHVCDEYELMLILPIFIIGCN